MSRKQSPENEELAALRARIHFRDPKDRSKTEGWQWALPKDTITILDHLGITPDEDEYYDGQEEMMRLRYPWKWLEKYQTKQGDMNRLMVKSKF